MYGNTGVGGYSADASSTWRNNIVFSNGPNFGLTSGTFSDNFTDDPMFINAAAGDFRLLAGSRALNACADNSQCGAYGPYR